MEGKEVAGFLAALRQPLRIFLGGVRVAAIASTLVIGKEVYYYNEVVREKKKNFFLGKG